MLGVIDVVHLGGQSGVWFVMLGVCCTVILSMMVIFFCSLRVTAHFRVTKVKGHADEGMVLDGRVLELDRWETTLPMRLLILAVGGLVMLLLMFFVTFLGSVVDGILLSCIITGSSLPCPGLL